MCVLRSLVLGMFRLFDIIELKFDQIWKAAPRAPVGARSPQPPQKLSHGH